MVSVVAICSFACVVTCSDANPECNDALLKFLVIAVVGILGAITVGLIRLFLKRDCD